MDSSSPRITAVAAVRPGLRTELPRATGDLQGSTVGPVELPTGTETLLLVEDEPAVEETQRPFANLRELLEKGKR